MRRGRFSHMTPHPHRAKPRFHPSATTPGPPLAFLREELGSKVATFSTSVDAGSPARVEDPRPISSYSWIEARTPTISVPASPNIWTDENPIHVPRDSGLVFIHQNGYRMSTGHPTAPLFAAVDTFVESYDYSVQDVISDRNSLRKLMRWAIESPDLKDFRIDIDLAGNTCIFTRREAEDFEEVSHFSGYGREYLKASTRLPEGLDTSITDHHRIMAMNFGGINILLRYVVDACSADATPPKPISSNTDDLVNVLSNMKISSGSSPAPTTDLYGVTIQKSPHQELVPQSSLIELKTRAAYKQLEWDEVYPQLYLSQTGYLYLAKHTKGVFQPVEKTKLADMKAEATRAEGDMSKLKAVLDAILAKVREAGSETTEFSLVCYENKLALYKRKGGKPIPQEILDKFV